jgi:hypothetical protein
VSKPGGVCFEIGIEGLFASAHGEAAWSRHRSQMLDFNPKPANSEGKPVIPHTFGTLSSMEFSHGLTETDLCPSSATHVSLHILSWFQNNCASSFLRSPTF